MRAYLLGGRPIHFPFLSGILRYDCEPCDAPCCHGASLGIGRSRELVTLMGVEPQISLFAQPGFASSAMLSLSSPKEQCWFLGKEEHCRLHRVAGRDAKPAGCRLFPFQTIRSIGESITVMPDFLCPLQVARKPSDSGPTSYDELALELHRTGVPRGGHSPLPEPKDLPWRDAMRLERQIVEASADHLDDETYLDFAETQVALTAKILGTVRKKTNQRRQYLAMRRFLGTEANPSAKAVRELVALTGVLRLMTSVLPRREMPSILLALSVLTGIYEEMRGARRTPGTVVSMFRERLPFLYVLAHLHDRPMLLDPDRAKRMVAKLPAVRAPLLDVLEHLIDNGEQTAADTLNDILKAQGRAFAAPLSPEAVTMLTGLGKVLLRTGVFVPV